MIGELPAIPAAEALTEPARMEGVDYEYDAVGEIVTCTEGYPYFIQEFGRTVWDLAEGLSSRWGCSRSEGSRGG